MQIFDAKPEEKP